MKKMIKLKFLAMLIISAAMLASCNKNEDPGPDEPKPDVPVVVELQNASVSGMVLDVEGKPLQGVTVSTGTLGASTDADGKFAFNQVGVVGVRSVIRTVN